mmetsp:Transcript_30931/g.41057  ORF Transcript_30931/g.41057 Transcript_30931/m.41057 type:complete len:172 (+) Transcript_30931:233-748(+)|eukprot:CAMPEP_0185577754 /NCGR_PEP_ID=MMETSP0434-20130131/10947_1 /TAXON_ID=626734 ORGANISM="Favella taraikaensis, Strain Fe Narragansett Bay" /NCGR_SAMPLE_ID=MMETSP0434 /ASSEMBLY_ACC=CAM_ASM_000379 /LENGTH=171 /DNA_ID=CAMNT_0028195407 /DNA_START=191 /DNA_END=706 /DNA_ORIENTATION=-
MNELNRMLERTLEKVIFGGNLGAELFFQADFSRQLLILLEQKLKANEVARVDEFEAFLENLESWYALYLKDLNREKKVAIQLANEKLEKVAAQTIFECLARMTEDERKHFILKNQAFVDAKRLENGVSGRAREHDVAFELDLRKLTLANRLKLAEDLAKYVDKFHTVTITL